VPREDGSWFRAELDCSQRSQQTSLNKKMKTIRPSHDMSEINDKYNELRGEHSFLGLPDDEERFCPDGVGRYRQFKHGSIHWHPSTGAYETHGAIRDKWAQMQFELGPLGYPISDEPGRDPTLAVGSVNRCSEFQHGKTFCWSPDTQRYFMTVITSDGDRTDQAQARKMTNDQNAKCHVAIHTAATAAAGIGAGLAQLPGSDNVPLVAVQISMAIALGNIFKLQFSDAVIRGLVFTGLASMTGPVVARTISQILIGWIPFAGNAVNAATAAGITEALGWILANEFHKLSEEQL
jgi:uncharacterized protein (DUF697 family)